jgi:Uma2 family endonuclease
MPNGLQPVQDPFGLSRLAQQIRLNRAERQQRGLQAQQQQLLGLQIQREQAGLAQMAQQQQARDELLNVIQQNPDKDPDFVSLQFLSQRNPQAAQQLQSNIFSRSEQLAKINPKAAIDFLNRKTGTDYEFQGKAENLLKIGSPGLGRVLLVDPNTLQVAREFDLEKPVSVQEKKFEQQKIEKEAKQVERTRQSLAKIDTVINKVDEAIAKDLSATVDTIKANLGFSTLQQMREASPTGGALGAVSERELTLLNSAVTSLDPAQSTEAFRRNLEQVRTHFTNWKNAIQEAERQKKFDVDANGQQPKGPITRTINVDAQGNIIP